MKSHIVSSDCTTSSPNRQGSKTSVNFVRFLKREEMKLVELSKDSHAIASPIPKVPPFYHQCSQLDPIDGDRREQNGIYREVRNARP
jgi:hypothetical protein